MLAKISGFCSKASLSTSLNAGVPTPSLYSVISIAMSPASRLAATYLTYLGSRNLTPPLLSAFFPRPA